MNERQQLAHVVGLAFMSLVFTCCLIWLEVNRFDQNLRIKSLEREVKDLRGVTNDLGHLTRKHAWFQDDIKKLNNDVFIIKMGISAINGQVHALQVKR